MFALLLISALSVTDDDYACTGWSCVGDAAGRWTSCECVAWELD